MKEYFEPVLFENLPPPSRPMEKPYLQVLDKCLIYLLMLDREYGRLAGKCSAVHHEYNLARKKNMPSLAMIKGKYDTGREPKTRAFIDRIKEDKFTYKRFADRIDLKKEVSAWLEQILKEDRNIVPATGVAESAEETIEAASTFEALQQDDVTRDNLDIEVSRSLFTCVRGTSSKTLSITQIAPLFRVRGLVWRDGESGVLYPTATGVVFLAYDPAMRFPQCQILADAYRDIKVTSKPFAQRYFSSPLPKLIEDILNFVHDHTQHPTRIIGINNVELDEYPRKAVREALVNAFAHRDYEDTTRKIRVEIFRN